MVLMHENSFVLRDFSLEKGRIAAKIDDRSGREGSRRAKAGDGEDR